MSEAKDYTGSCHCGAVAYTVNTDLSGMLDCNCSRCQRLGVVWQPASADQFTLLRGAESLTEYHFNTDRIDHLFCAKCGIESFARGTGADGTKMVMLNVNCFEGLDPVDRSTIHHWNGRAV